MKGRVQEKARGLWREVKNRGGQEEKELARGQGWCWGRGETGNRGIKGVLMPYAKEVGLIKGVRVIVCMRGWERETEREGNEMSRSLWHRKIFSCQSMIYPVDPHSPHTHTHIHTCSCTATSTSLHPCLSLSIFNTHSSTHTHNPETVFLCTYLALTLL